MSCETFDKLINLFLDGRLDQSQEKKLKEHLSQCKACHEKLSFLQSIEAKARGIRAEEPPRAYWDTFSTRVTERIRTREEKSVRFGLKKVLDSVFSYSPLKVKVAAGVISVVFVFIVGKLYVDYRGEQIMPSKKVAKVHEPPRVDIAQIELEEESPPAEKGEGRKPVLDKQEVAREDAADLRREIVPSKKGEEEKAVAQRGEVAPSLPTMTRDEAAHVPAAPAVQIPLPEEGKAKEQAAVKESKTAGAGVDREIEQTEKAKGIDLERSVRKGPTDSTREEIEELLAYTVGFVKRPPRPAEAYSLRGSVIPGIVETDTLVPEDTLRQVIQVWGQHMEEHPSDSLARHGYLQIATAYYLLAKISQDTSVISEGSLLIEQYLKQVRDPAIKEDLNHKLIKIQALREK